jgi:ABC-type transport system involved in cytochrome c biogenesis permease subunit
MKKFLSLLFLILLFVPFLVFAQTASVNPCSVAAIPASGNRAQALPRCINQIYLWSLGLSALLAVLILIIGGYYYMSSGGNAEQASKGVGMIWSAVIGLGLLFGAYLILNTINPDLVKFPVDSLNNFDQTQTTPPGVRK